MLHNCKQWLDDRVGIKELVATKFRRFMIPQDAGILSGLGGIAVIAFLVLRAVDQIGENELGRALGD